MAEGLDYDINLSEGTQQIVQPKQQSSYQPPSISYGSGVFDGSSHPWACFFHLFFKIFALATYLIIFYFTGQSQIFTFILVAILLSLDFWTTQNVTGRLLVGLRWKNIVAENGKEEWIFESLNEDQQKNLNTKDSSIFWVGLVSNSVVWLFFLLVNIISLDIFWCIVDIFASSLAVTNLIGFAKCRKDWKTKIRQYAADKAISGARDFVLQPNA